MIVFFYFRELLRSEDVLKRAGYLMEAVQEEGHELLSIMLGIAAELTGLVGQEGLEAGRLDEIPLAAPELAQDDGKRDGQRAAKAQGVLLVDLLLELLAQEVVLERGTVGQALDHSVHVASVAQVGQPSVADSIHRYRRGRLFLFFSAIGAGNRSGRRGLGSQGDPRFRLV